MDDSASTKVRAPPTMLVGAYTKNREIGAPNAPCPTGFPVSIKVYIFALSRIIKRAT
jgi:hypothetical protein